jgi:PAS domain S-box-containing protein
MSSGEVAAALDLFEIAPCGYLFNLPDGTLTRANRTFLQWTGYTEHALLNGKRFQDLLTRPTAIFYETHFAPLLRMQGFLREITIDFLCSDGSVLPSLVNSSIHRDSSGEPLLILTTVFDIRERRRYERELLLERRRAEQWALVVETATEAIMTADSQARFTSWNRGAESLFGYTAAEVLGRKFPDLLVPESSLKQFEEFLVRLRSGESLQQEMMLRQKNGNRVDAFLSITPHIEPVQEYAGFSAIMRNLRAQRKIQKAQQIARDLELANQLAHEINNPLQAIVNCLALVSTSDNSAYLRMMQENVDRIRNVITKLVEVTRV